MRYMGVAKDQKNAGESASIFELDSVEELEEFDPVDAGWEVEKIPPGKTEFEEFLTDNLDTLKSNVADTFKQAKESFDAVINVTKKSLPEQPDGRAKKRAGKRAKSTFRSTTSQARSTKAKNNQSIPEIADTTKETETDDLIQDSTQESGAAFENIDPKSEQNAKNIGELPEASLVELPEVDESKTEGSSADALQEEQIVTNKEENLDPNNRGDDLVKEKLDHDKLNHGIITNQESYGERASQQNTLKPNAITDAKDSVSGDTSTLNAKTEDSSPAGLSYSESMDDKESKTAKGTQYENPTPQAESTLNAKTENVAQQQDDPVVGFCDCIPSCSCMHQNNTLAAEENVSQRNDSAIDPCDSSNCSKSDEAKEEIQESIPSTEGGRDTQVTTVPSGGADCSIAKGIGQTLDSSKTLTKILPSLPFCKSECANTVIYSTDPIIENVRDGHSDGEN
ncbi:hypothetical protein AS219_02375 [Neorickettsia sp. 179522]|nr:hypothetical protein AS219_02375 [Neorickettsia sp. 179522]